MRKSIFDAFERWPDAIALIDRGVQSSYRTLKARGDEIARHVAPETLTLVLCRNETDCVAAYTGLMRAGRAQMLVHHTIKANQLLGIIDAFRPEYLFLPDDAAKSFADAAVIAHFGGYQLVAGATKGGGAPHDDLAVLLSTSGTTGSHNFVRLSFDNIHANTQQINEYLGITPAERTITTMPMSYSYGLSILNTHLSAGASVVLTEDGIMARSFWDTFHASAITSFGGVPFIYELLKKLRFAKMDISGLRYITQAGGRMPIDLMHDMIDTCAEKGVLFVAMYGQTEATARISYVPAARARDKAGSIGIAIPGGRMWLADESGDEISAPGTAGELMYEGANVSMGYAVSRADLGRGDDNRGVIATGDIAVRDEDGYMSIVGRKKRFLKIYGHRVNLDEIERQLCAAGFDCACVGEDGHMQVYVADGGAVTKVGDLIGEITTLHPRGYSVSEIDVLPRNSAGKIAYPKLPAGGDGARYV
ncbi:AMP-binding protein [Thalassospiraceae bacterium LMO-JJ14]|nr:AMP-binding protein [Thalassospiraceae bacterium LMO-JJ14]